MPFIRIFPYVSIICLIPTTAAIPKMRASPQLNVGTTTIVSSSTTTFLAISTQYDTPSPSTTPSPFGPPWATKPWFPPTYTWKASQTTGRTSASTHLTPSGPSIPPPALLPGREIHPNWNSRWCLAVRARKIVDGTPVEIDRCSGSLGEHWEFKGNPGRTSIRVAGTNLCLDGEIDSIVRIRTCSDHIPTQDWYITEDERFALTGTGRCLDRLNGGLSPGTEVQTYGCTDDNTNQVWTS